MESEDYQAIYETLKTTFRIGTTKPLAWRRNQLYQLARLVQENFDALLDAIGKDLSKPKIEFLGEATDVINRTLRVASLLEEWSKAEPIEVFNKAFEEWQPKINKAPKGVVLIISPWNVPLLLSLQPLYGAIAAGCPAVVKPSELVPNFSSLLGEIFNKYLDPSAYRLVNGGIPETTQLLEFRWAHIFYTGNGRVARIIAAAGAKHLTPVTLELGGKSPVIIDSEYDIEFAARRIISGKAFNCGQVCVSPDYVLVPRNRHDSLLEALRRAHDQMFPGGSLGTADLSRIINKAHHERLKSLLSRTQGKVAFGGASDEKNRMEITVVGGVSLEDSLMEDEIFGPILPIVPVDTMIEAIGIINDRPNPLVLYAFTDDSELQSKLLEDTLSGVVVFNSTTQQLIVDELPLVGVGESGYGYQMMKLTYDGFTHMRPSANVPRKAPGLEAPHTEEDFQELKKQLEVQIPVNS